MSVPKRSQKSKSTEHVPPTVADELAAPIPVPPPNIADEIAAPIHVVTPPPAVDDDEDVDPFDPKELAKLRLSQDFAELSDVRPMHIGIDCRKPHNQEFIRVRPGAEHQFPITAFVDKDSKEVYMVANKLRNELVGKLRATLLVVCVSRNSPLDPFLWGLVIPGADGGRSKWHDSAIEAARVAETQWIQLGSNMSTSRYTVGVAKGVLPEPDWSETPSIGELMKMCFKDRFIGTYDHPVLKRLRGEV